MLASLLVWKMPHAPAGREAVDWASWRPVSGSGPCRACSPHDEDFQGIVLPSIVKRAQQDMPQELTTSEQPRNLSELPASGDDFEEPGGVT